MNYKKHLISFLMGVLTVNAAFARIASVIEHRSQSSNTARKVAGEFGYVHLHDQDSWYARFASTLEYQRSFRSKELARALFGCYVNDCSKIIIQGSAVQGRAANALLADYFYLPPDFESVVTIKPVISDVIFDFNYYMGFDCACFKNCYLRVYGPLVRSKWITNMKECVLNPGTEPYRAGYFTPCAMPRNQMLTDFCDYISGGEPAIQCGTIMHDQNREIDPDNLFVGDELATTVFQGLKYYNACCNGSHTATTMADLRAELGWNFVDKEYGHLGVCVEAAFPTGTRPNAQYMFNPVVGNGKHWEFGGGITAHAVLWQCGDFEKIFSANLDANFTHMFPNHEQRTFDLNNLELSRFMLAQRLGAQTANVGALAGSDDGGATFNVPCGQFKYEFAPVANLTTLDIKVKSSLQFDMAIWFNFTNHNLSVDLGYNAWVRSCDRIEPRELCHQCPNLCDPENYSVWVLKGDAQVYGFAQNERVVTNGCNPDFAIALSTSQTGTVLGDGATITGGGPLDNPELAYGNLDGNELLREELFDAPIAGAQVETSVSPIYINCRDIAICTQNKGVSNKLWTNIQWTWDLDRNCLPIICRPFLGIGAEVEFGKVDPDCNTGCSSPSCPSSSSCIPCVQPKPCKPIYRCDENCINVAASQWGIWLKGGVNFE